MMIIRCVISGLVIATSLAIGAASVLLWARSYSRMDGFVYCDASGTRSHGLYSRYGSIHYLFCGGPQLTSPGWKNLGGPQPEMFAVISDRPKWHFLGAGYGDSSGGGTRAWWVSVPCWALLAISLLPWLIWLSHLRRQRLRRRRGLCANCGYDLRGTPQRCPECGMVAVARRLVQ